MLPEIETEKKYTVTSGVLSYTAPFPLYEKTDVSVVWSFDGGKETTLEFDTDYSVDIADNGESGTVTLVAGRVPVGATIAVKSAVPETQELDLSHTSDVDTEALEKELDRQVQMIQQLRDDIARTLKVAITSDKTPEEVINEILAVASKANEYAEQAKVVYDQVVKSAAAVEQAKQSVELSKQSVDASEANVTALTAQVLEYSDELELVAENVSGIQAINNNQDAISALAADLQGYPIYEFDGGPITDPNQSMNGVGGVLKVCADNIDAIKKVADSLEDSAALATLAEDVTEIGQTDYLTIASTGNSEPSNG